METNIRGFLLEIGNIVVNRLSEIELLRELPKNSWQITFSVDDTRLSFGVMLQYDIFIRNQLYVGDPTFWVPIIAFHTGSILSEIDINSISEVKIYIKVNEYDHEKDWTASCTLGNLVAAVNSTAALEDESAIKARIMSYMDVDQI